MSSHFLETQSAKHTAGILERLQTSADAVIEHARVTGLGVITTAALLGGVAPAEAASHEPAPVARDSRTHQPAVRLPGLAPNESVPQALSSLRQAHLKAAVAPGTSYPRAASGDAFVAGGWAVKTVKHNQDHGHHTKRTIYKALKTGAKAALHSTVYVRPKQVPLPRGIATPVNPASQPVDTQLPAEVAPVVINPITPAPPEITPPTPEQPLDVAAELAKFEKANTVYLPFLGGCSGFLIRDAAGAPIGVFTAEHCNLRTANTARVPGGDGKLYDVFTTSPFQALSGEDTAPGDMSLAGTVNQAILPAATDTSHDLAVLVFNTSTPAAVLAAANTMRLSDSQVQSSAAGQQDTVSGYPVDQPGNTTGFMRRETESLTLLSGKFINTLMDTGKVLTDEWYGNTPANNPDGTACSPGLSGAAIIRSIVSTKPDGKKSVSFKVVGVQSGHDDYRGADGEALRAARQQQTGLQIPYPESCIVSTLQPSPADTVQLVNDVSKIPKK